MLDRAAHDPSAFDGRQLLAVPIVLSMNDAGETPRRVPYLAEGGEARVILLGLANASRPLGTEIRIEGDNASLVLRTSRANVATIFLEDCDRRAGAGAVARRMDSLAEVAPCDC